MKGNLNRNFIQMTLAVLTMTVPAALFAEYEFQNQFGSFGSSNGQFDSPRGVAVTSDNRIVVSESGNNRIQICSFQGACSDFGSFGVETGEFDRPRGVAMDNSGKIVVADRGNDRIQICSTTGSCDDMGGSGAGLGQFESPRGVAVNSQGRIIVADTENHRIQLCNAMASCSAFGSLGGSPGQFDSPVGVAIDQQGQIVVSDRMNNRVQLCSAQGSCTAFGRSGSGLGQFNGLTGVAVDSQNRIVLVDRFNHRIQVCTSQGSCTAFGSFGSGAGQFDSPWGVAVDRQDRIIVADLGNNRIQIFYEPDPVPEPVVITSFTASPTSIETGQSVTLSWSVENASDCTAQGGTSGWSGFSIDPAGGDRVITIDSAGSHTFTLSCSGGGETVSSSIQVSVTEPVVLFHINAGLSDAWYLPATAGQGFFIIVWEDIKIMFLAWFTYETERPPQNVTALLGEPGHRWVTAQGPYEGDTATLEMFVSEGGVFDSSEHEVETNPDGYMTLTFSGCNEGLVSYEITSLNRSGEVPIERIVPDNIPLCEILAEEAAAQ